MSANTEAHGEKGPTGAPPATAPRPPKPPARPEIDQELPSAGVIDAAAARTPDQDVISPGQHGKP